MKKTLCILPLLSLLGCAATVNNDNNPLVVKEVKYSRLTGTCTYRLEAGFGEVHFDDSCGKYNPGDTLKITSR